jgi:hypothetical protein
MVRRTGEMIENGTFKFIGSDSVGYINGELYELRIESGHFGLTDSISICSKYNHLVGRCVYGSMVSFWNNWVDIKPKPIKRTYSEMDPYGGSLGRINRI